MHVCKNQDKNSFASGYTRRVTGCVWTHKNVFYLWNDINILTSALICLIFQDVGTTHLCDGLYEQNLGYGLNTLVLWNNQITYQSMGALGRALVSTLLHLVLV